MTAEPPPYGEPQQPPAPWWTEPPAADAPPVPEGAGPRATEVLTTGGGHPPVHRTGTPRSVTVIGLIAGLLGAVLGGGVVAIADHKDDGDKGSASVGTVANPKIEIPQASASAGPLTGVAAIAAQVLPSVVTIQEKTDTAEGTGSGVVISADGYILTNDHVVADFVDAPAGSASLKVIPNGGTSADALTATVVGKPDTLDDLAVIKVSPTAALKPATLGHSDSLHIGDTVVAIGAPLGLDGTVTEGIVSATQRFFTVGGSSCSDTSTQTAYAGAIQTDAAINPGNSGGALVDSSGTVVGINSAIATTGGSLSGDEGGSIGVGFAIPIDVAAPVAQQIIRDGEASHAFLGVSTDDSSAPEGARIADQQDPCGGPKVNGVTQGSPADKAGLKVGDVITKVDGTTIRGYQDLITAIRRDKVGQTVTVTYVRNGQTQTAEVTLSERPKSNG
ncbi:MAG TPA: trypsin-like peptidase domain-containing protein [Mycobacteriales bacterium]|nr:trypsin-like peptidase domain-containing protein [Mycobacteriales bacterium]